MDEELKKKIDNACADFFAIGRQKGLIESYEAGADFGYHLRDREVEKLKASHDRLVGALKGICDLPKFVNMKDEGTRLEVQTPFELIERGWKVISEASKLVKGNVKED